jgi:putative ABC transport system permease protein
MIGAMIAEAWSALASNKLRSALTMLGMIIGVSAVIVMLAIGEGVKTQVAGQIGSLGSNLLIVAPGAAKQRGFSSGAGTGATLTMDDAAALARLPKVTAAAPSAVLSAQIIAGPNNWATQVDASTPAWIEVQGWPVSDGRMFTEGESRSAARVALLGQTVAGKLFGADEAVGRDVRIRGVSVRVIGLLEKKGQGFGGGDRDDLALVPLTTAQRLLQANAFRKSIGSIALAVATAGDIAPTQALATATLRRLHDLGPGVADDFQVADLSAILSTVKVATASIGLLLLAIGSISLVVGGIGIMNIMLVSVTERTREIGIRMAIGAPRGAIQLQFLLEAIMLSVFGCAVGVALGYLGATALEGPTGLQTTVTLQSVLIAFAVSVTIGVFFGWYPATRAARLSPIEALRA